MRILTALAFLPLPAFAEVPVVVTDIMPVHSLTARVMQGVGEPVLLVGPGGDPHHYQLKPSQARALASAGAVFWIGPDLTPWLGEVIEGLADPASSLELAEADGVTERPPLFGGDHHEDEDAHEEDHDHGDHDAHLWLDPQNAAAMTRVIAARLAALDPENAAAYAANAQAAEAELTALETDLTLRLTPLRNRPFVVFHDAYAHLAGRFGLTLAGSLAEGDAASPGAATIARLRDLVRDGGAVCVFAEAQHSAALSETLTEGLTVGTGTLDPLDGPLPPGPEAYPAMMRALANELSACLQPG